VADHVVEVQRLVGGARPKIIASRLQHQAVGLIHVGVAGQHQLHRGGLDRARGHLIQGLQHFHAALGLRLGAVHFELLVAVCNLDLQGRFDGAQMLVHGAAQVRQAGVVVGCEQVSENQADNSSL
jgi:hypothetical protein